MTTHLTNHHHRERPSVPLLNSPLTRNLLRSGMNPSGSSSPKTNTGRNNHPSSRKNDLQQQKITQHPQPPSHVRRHCRGSQHNPPRKIKTTPRNIGTPHFSEPFPHRRARSPFEAIWARLNIPLFKFLLRFWICLEPLRPTENRLLHSKALEMRRLIYLPLATKATRASKKEKVNHKILTYNELEIEINQI